MQTSTHPFPKPIYPLIEGIIPTHLRGKIHSTPAANTLISIRAKQGPARNGRKKYKGPIRYSTDNHPLFSII